jgi:hypothetical protein
MSATVNREILDCGERLVGWLAEGVSADVSAAWKYCPMPVMTVPFSL